MFFDTVKEKRHLRGEEETDPPRLRYSSFFLLFTKLQMQHCHKISNPLI